MTKFTRRIKRNKKNKTKRGGNKPVEHSKNNKTNIENEDNKKDEEREGVVDMISDEISDVTTSAFNTLTDAGLKIIGLERIDKKDDGENNENLNQINNTASDVLSSAKDTTNNMISSAKEVANNASTSVINSVNEVLGSDAVNESIKKAANETAQITEKLLENFNDTLDKPEVKKEVKEAIENAGEIGSVVVDASREPFNKAVDVMSEAVPKATGAAMSGLVKVGTDMMAAVPGVGSIIEVGKMLNDSTKAASAVVEAGSEAVDAASDIFIDTKENIEKGMKELEEKKKLGEQISQRTTDSINQFENPLNKINSTKKGGRRTKKFSVYKRRKSKRVRFAV